MKLNMTIDEALEFADEWSRGMTLHEGSQGWRVVCMLLAEEVRRMREGLTLITCESINAEYMAQNILDGLPAYHDTMIKPSNAGGNATERSEGRVDHNVMQQPGE